MKVGMVVPSYGLASSGEAARRCRLLAHRLATHHAVEVLTTTSASGSKSVTLVPAGVEQSGPLRVRRFPASDAYSSPSEARGPVSPELQRHLRDHGRDHDAFIFFSSLAWTAAEGLPWVGRKSLLVPLVSGPAGGSAAALRSAAQSSAATVFDTPEEKALVESIAGTKDLPGDVVGTGIEDAGAVRAPEAARRLEPGTYLLHAGPLDPRGGCAVMLDRFLRYQRESRAALTLVLSGEGAMTLSENVHVRQLPALPDGERWAAMHGALAVLVPSIGPGLDLSVLEAWWMRRPVLGGVAADGQAGLLRRSGGGLWCRSYDDFKAALDLLRQQPELAGRLGAQGREHFDAHYAWPVVMAKYDRLLSRAAAGGLDSR